MVTFFHFSLRFEDASNGDKVKITHSVDAKTSSDKTEIKSHH